ncbi:MAG TPA: NAD-dependent epimerase/dehydratase family protein, partial [Verrucomicrobiae bacterium]|nr:NAD-dependent epimerase/dehydratase family protein [Verrucomicrobiae bacterium]
MNVERSTFNAQHRTDGGRRTGGNGIASAGSEFPRRLAAKLAGRAAFCQARGVTIDRSAPVLVTGSAGRIGQAAVAALTAAGWRVRGFDRAPTPGAAESITGDLTDAEALRRATRLGVREVACNRFGR